MSVATVNNDGWKDIFVANGIYKDLTNGDFIQYMSSPEFNQMTANRNIDFKDFINLILSQSVPNNAFSNNGNLTFTNKAEEWGLDDQVIQTDRPMVDLDLVVNNC